jgi:nucleoside-diphosphate-sugar epimerase
MPKWIGLLMDSAQPVLYGDDSATRDFCHVDNVCEAFLRAADLKPKGGHAVFNVGTGVSTCLGTLYDTICRKLRDGVVVRNIPDLKREPARDGEILQSVADTAETAADRGFRATVDLEEGLTRLLAEQYGLSFPGDQPRSHQ